MIYLVGIAWMYVVLMVAVAEASAANGTLLGAFFTLLMWGVLPMLIVGYVMGAPARAQARRAAAASGAGVDPDGGDHAASEAVAAERKEP
jgi:hypothetical protein